MKIADIQLKLSQYWYRFSQNKASIAGLLITVAIVVLTIFAPHLTPYPEHSGAFVDFRNTFQPPSSDNWFGTDQVGRDIFTRSIFGYRFSLIMAGTVLGIAVPLGVVLGLVSGYFGGWLESLIMRLTDIVLALPPLAMAIAVSAVLGSDLVNTMIALAMIWWTGYARLVHGMVVSVRNEEYVEAAQIMGASRFHIMFREILPNCAPAILVKT